MELTYYTLLHIRQEPTGKQPDWFTSHFSRRILISLILLALSKPSTPTARQA